MTGDKVRDHDPRICQDGWTISTLQWHWAIVERIKSEYEEKFQKERDRRYSEVNIEREKALKIKEEADKAALGLAREIQTYKDEKANELREQINSERGLYVTKDELISSVREITAKISPLTDFVAGSTGREKGTSNTIYFVYLLILAVGAGVGIWATVFAKVLN